MQPQNDSWWELASSIATKIHSWGPFVQRISNLNNGPWWKKKTNKNKTATISPPLTLPHASALRNVYSQHWGSSTPRNKCLAALVAAPQASARVRLPSHVSRMLMCSYGFIFTHATRGECRGHRPEPEQGPLVECFSKCRFLIPSNGFRGCRSLAQLKYTKIVSQHAAWCSQQLIRVRKSLTGRSVKHLEINEIFFVLFLMKLICFMMETWARVWNSISPLFVFC